MTVLGALSRAGGMVGQGGVLGNLQSVTTMVDDWMSSWNCGAEFMWIVLDMLI